MKLSDAILLGSLTGPQIQNRLSDNHGGTCAMGSAYKALGISTQWVDTPNSVSVTVWPWLNRPCGCPVCHLEMSAVTYVITNHLNDTHKWTREQIAAWVATIEPPEISAEVPCQTEELEAACTTQK